MKIRNTSTQDLTIQIQHKGKTAGATMKPGQVMYLEGNSQTTKQIIIYEKKKLVASESGAEKPHYVDYYKPFFESGTYSPAKEQPVITFEEDDSEETETLDIPEAEYMPEQPEQAVADHPALEPEGEKKKRGRPKKPVDTSIVVEKKKPGRPKGSTKNKQA